MQAFDTNLKPTLGTYAEWLLARHGVNVGQQKSHYETVTSLALQQLGEETPWKDIIAALNNLNDEYKIQRGDDLIEFIAPTLISKSFPAFLNKTYRKNVLSNLNFPDAPDGGWVLPPEWLSQISDIIRTTIVVRYLDGVEYLSARIQKLCDDLGVETEFDFESRVEGYYAGHLSFRKNVDIPNLQWQPESRTLSVEVQMTTHVKEAVKAILHPLYEQARVAAPLDAGKDWRWDFSSDEFVASNLGHIVHYVEGMIVRIRDEQRKSRS